MAAHLNEPTMHIWWTQDLPVMPENTPTVIYKMDKVMQCGW